MPRLLSVHCNELFLCALSITDSLLFGTLSVDLAITAHCSAHVDPVKVMKYTAKLRAKDCDNQKNIIPRVKNISAVCTSHPSLAVLWIYQQQHRVCLCTFSQQSASFLLTGRLIERWIWTQWERPAAVSRSQSFSQLTITLIDTHTHTSVWLCFMLLLYANIQTPTVVRSAAEDTKGKNSFRIRKRCNTAAAVKPITVER